MDKSARPRKRVRPAPKAVQEEAPTPSPQLGHRWLQRRQRDRTSIGETEEASTLQAEAPLPEEEVSKPKKRVRPPKVKAPEPAAEEGINDDGDEPKSRAARRNKQQQLSNYFPSKSRVENGAENGPSAQGATKKRKRETKAANAQAGEEVEPEPETEAEPVVTRKKRARPPKNSRPSVNEPPDEEVEPDPETEAEPVVAKKGRRRPPKNSRTSKNGPTNAQAEEEVEPEPETEAEPSSVITKKKRARPSTNRQSAGNESVVAPQRRARPPVPRKKANSASGLQKELSELQNESDVEDSLANATRQKSKKRARNSEEQEQSQERSSSPESDTSIPPYRHITERTRRVTRDVLDSKWSSLDASSVSNVANLLHAASQPTLHHVPPKQYTHAEDVIEKIIRGLCRRSGRLPFPPASTLSRREDELDFEQTQSAVEVLLSQLDPLQHSVEVLKRARESAQKDLEREYKLLDRLSTNARAEAEARRDQLRKIHDLVPEPTSSLADKLSSIDLHAANREKGSGQVFSGIKDDELLALAGQISNHMESMRGNLSQIDGVLPAIEESQALLKTTLQPHFGQKQLENIFLGQNEL